jgi:hypothetical protein
MSKSANYIAFIDLLGTTEFALEDKVKFYNRLISFQETITNNCHLLAGDGRVFFFSDSAYIESDNLDKLVTYLRKVRKALLELGLYMKGAIGTGELNASDPHNSNLIKDRKEVKLRKETVIGHCFGEDVVPIYALQAGLKGVGIRIAENLTQDFVKKGYGVASCYLPIENNRRAECFYDLKLDDSELNDGILKLYLRNFYVTNTKSKKYGRYYLPFIVSWINSTDFSATVLTDSSNGTGSSSVPLIFDLLLLSRSFDKHFTDLVGLEYVFFALLNKIFIECDSEKVKRRVFEYIASRKKLLSRLGTLPTCVMSSETKKQFLEKLSGKVALIHP